MIIPNLTHLDIIELLTTHTEVLKELRKRDVIRSNNNPTGDYAEWLVSKKIGLARNNNSVKGFDAIDSGGMRYQSKGRRVTPENNSTQLGVIRNLDAREFDFLIAVILRRIGKYATPPKFPTLLCA